MNTRVTKAVVLVLLGILAAGFHAVRTINIKADGSGDYPTIQAAIDATVAGDTIVLWPGTYTGAGNRSIDFKGKAIKVRSTDPNNPNIAAGTVIDCQSKGRGFWFHSREVANSVIEGFTIVNGSYSSNGGGIYCDSNSCPTIRKCTIKGSKAGIAGGGIYFGGGCIISECTIVGNSVSSSSTLNDGKGGGIYCKGICIISGCRISENNVTGPNGWNGSYGGSGGTGYNGYGGGIYCGKGSNLEIKACLLTDNFEYGGAGGNGANMGNGFGIGAGGNGGNGFGGGVYSDANSICNISHCTTADNGVGGGPGGLGGVNPVNPTVPHGSPGNPGKGYGGGFCGRAEITNSIIYGNSGDYGREAAVLKNSTLTSNLSISYCDIEKGSASIYVDTGGVLNWGRGNIDEYPLFTNDYHLTAGSGCTGAGDPNWGGSNEKDFDGELIGLAGHIDIGADEFIDSDGDGLPDWWEVKYFWNATAGNANGDEDGDFYNNQAEYEMSSDPFVPAANFYVDPVTGNDSWDGKASVSSGGHGPKKTIQAAINVSSQNYGERIILATGTYTGTGNRDITFMGKIITVRSTEPNDPNVVAATIIDCQGTSSSRHRGFWFCNREGRGSVLAGVKIINGYGPTEEIQKGTGLVSAGAGGAILCDGASPTITKCVMEKNRADIGAGVCCIGGSQAVISHCTIGPITYDYHYVGDGIACWEGSDAIISDCLIRSNCGSSNSGISCNGSNPAISNCVITDNGKTFYVYDDYGGIHCDMGASPTISNCSISSNRGSGISSYLSGGPMGKCMPNISNCTISGNKGLGISFVEGGGSITNCTISGNNGGGINGDAYGFDGPITNCIISGNGGEPSPQGGPYGGLNSCIGSIRNCVIVGNTTGYGYGGGLNNCREVTNCIIMGNKAQYHGGGVSGWTGTISNCIIRENLPDQIYKNPPDSTISINWSDIKGGWAGIGNIDIEPMLTRDYHLQAGSACINAGDPNYVTTPDEKDMDGETRLAGGRIDIGADEFIDSDGDGLPDWWEEKYFDSLTAAEPNGNPDGDSWTNIEEYIRAMDPLTFSDYCVNPADGNDNWDGRKMAFDGVHGPKRTIQAAIDACAGVARVQLAAGIYRGNGNRDIDFKGKSIVVSGMNPDDPCVVAATVIDCEGTNSQPHRGFKFHSGEGLDSELSGVTIINGYAPFENYVRGYYGGAILCYGSNPTISNCVMTNNNAVTGGGVFGQSSDAEIINCVIKENTGSGLYFYLCNAMVNDCIVSENSVSGIYCYNNNSIVITNCVINGNSNTSGGGIYCYDTNNLIITNCTITGNRATEYVGGGIFSAADKPANTIITNSILWGNIAPDGNGPAICLNGGSYEVSNSDVEGGRDKMYVFSGILDWGAGNIDAEPWIVNGYQLGWNSPCIEAGTNNPTGGLAETDIDGNARVFDGDNSGIATVDIGCWEFVANGPVTGITPSEIEFAAEKDGANPADKVFGIRNRGIGTLAWSITEDCPWLSVNPASGESTGEVDEVGVSVNIAGLEPAVYSYDLTVSGAGAMNNPQEVMVKLHVHKSGEIYVPAEYGTIQTAIDVAADGDKIIVSEGTYQENIDFKGKKIILKSTDPNNSGVVTKTVISGYGVKPVVRFSNGEVSSSVLSGFTIRGGGKGILSSKVSPVIKNCRIVENVGMGIYDANNMTAINETIINCIVAKNGGDGINTYSSKLNIVNCTIVQNGGKGIYVRSHNVPMYIKNSIIRDNSLELSGTASVTYSDVKGGWAGVGNIDADPMFVDASGDYHLLPGSVCVDAGDPNSDYSQEPMPNGGRIDIGAYGNTAGAASGGRCDLNGDGIVDNMDFGLLAETWTDTGNYMKSLAVMAENWLK